MAYSNILIISLGVLFPTIAFSSLFDMEAVGEPKLFFNGQVPNAVTKARLGQSLVLHCSAGGSPSPTIHWLFKGSRIPQGISNSVTDDEPIYESNNDLLDQPTLRLSGTKSRLFIDCLTPEDVGQYTCVAETPTKRIVSETVVEIDNSISGGEFLDSCVMKRIERGHSARIYMWTVQRLEIEGADVQLFCRATGSPVPKVMWYDTNNQPISSKDHQYELLANGDLLIHKINWEGNMGSYRCVASNKHGKDETSIFLYPTYL